MLREGGRAGCRVRDRAPRGGEAGWRPRDTSRTRQGWADARIIADAVAIRRGVIGEGLLSPYNVTGPLSGLNRLSHSRHGPPQPVLAMAWLPVWRVCPSV